MNVLITGCLGLLGQRLVELAPPNAKVAATDLEPDPQFMPASLYHPCDLTRFDQVRALFDRLRPDCVINAAAYTNVDRAEDEPDRCRTVNVTAVEHLARLCGSSALLIQVSTDYVFDGAAGPYAEDAPTNPLGVYAKSKWEAEQAVRAAGVDHVIARTMVLYGHTRNCRPEFVGWLIDKLAAAEPVRIVTDQFGNATLNDELAQALWRLAFGSFRGVVHVAGTDVLSRYDFSLRIAELFGLDAGLITPITTAELKQKAPRPLRSGLIVDKAVRELGLELSDTVGGLRKYQKMRPRRLSPI